ncbi:hypothetical protein HOE22_10200 [Candidatus Woesearchaeota archaeon]|nr:hypothetical protein [Candidatus Woesearchaeota archaeon]
MTDIYDIYYSTGGGPIIRGGSDVWVNYWIDNIAPKLKVKPILLIHNQKPSDGLAPNYNQVSPEPPQHFAVVEGMDEKVKEVDEKIEIVYFDTNNTEQFDELIKNSRRVNILDGHYKSVWYLENNKDKIYSVVLHVKVNDALNVHKKLGLEKTLRFNIEPEWEENLIKWSKYPIWIGTNKLEDKKTKFIPNFYEFQHNKELDDSDLVGYTARVETRKAPHFLNGIKSLAFTSSDGIEWWRENIGEVFDKTKVYDFSYDNLDRFYNLKWGISHSCFINEPFGYSIFQALDYGKIPIISKDWCEEYDYPYRANNKIEFDEVYKILISTEYNIKNKVMKDFREYLKKYDNIEEWVIKYLEIYNADSE